MATALKTPPSVPTASAARAATQISTPPTQRMPRVMAESPITEPSDRSMPPVMMTSVSARAVMPTWMKSEVAYSSMDGCRNTGLMAPNNKISAIRSSASTLSQRLRAG